MSDDDQIQSDPRPVYEGDWNSASGEEKGKHSERVRQWKARQAGSAQSPMAAGSQPPATPNATHAAATRSVLVAIRDDSSAHDSDRIRAAQALIALDREEAAGSASQPSALSALRDVLDLLAPEDRLAWLQGERLEHVQAKGRAAASGGVD